MKKTYFFLFTLLLSLGAANATVYHVNPASTATEEGLSWSTAYQTIEAALAVANTAGDEIWVKQGTYTPATTLAWKNGVNVYGGFVGSETDKNARSKDASLTIIDGGAANRRILATSANLTATTTWSGFTLQNSTGGGVQMHGNTVLENTTVQNNTAANVAGIMLSGSPVVIRGSKILNNESTAVNTGNKGGGIGQSAGVASITIENCEVRGNKAGTQGAGISLNTATTAATIKNCIIAENASTLTNGAGTWHGAAVWVANANITANIINCVIANNRACSSIYFYNSASPKIYLYNTIFFNNTDYNADGLIAGDRSLNFVAANVQSLKAFTNNITDNILSHTQISYSSDGGTNQVVSDSTALFANNYRPLINFAGKDQGTTSGTNFSLPTTDITGDIREAGTIDIGPYEIQNKTITLTQGINVTLTSPASEETVTDHPFNSDYTVAFSTDYLPIVTVNGKDATAALTGTTPNYSLTVKNIVSPTTAIHIAAAQPKVITVANLATADLTVAETSAAEVGSTGTYNVPEGQPFTLKLTVAEQYQPTVTISTLPAYEIPAPDATGVYTITIPAVDADATITLGVTTKTFPITLTKSEGITSEATNATVEWEGSYSFSFSVSAGYHLPSVRINNVTQVLGAPVAGVYTVSLANIKEAKNIVIKVYPNTVIPVSEDANIRVSGTADPQKLLLYNNGSNQIDIYLKFDLSTFATIRAANLKLTIGGYSATGKEATWKLALAENNWTEGTISTGNRPADITGKLADNVPAGIVTGTTATWMESSTYKQEITIPLIVNTIRSKMNAGVTVFTIHLSVPATVTSGGEIDIASKETDCTYGDPGFKRCDLEDCGAKLEITDGALATDLITLSSLTIADAPVQGFLPTKSEYALTLPEDATAYPAIVATATDESATIGAIVYNPTTYNPDGTNTATFTVTNGANTATYSIVFTNDKVGAIFRTIIGRIQAGNEDTYNVTSLATAVTTYLTTFNATSGRFTDINYSSTDGRTDDWIPLKHIDRMKDMAFAYTLPGSDYFESEDLYNKIVLALNAWATGTFSCDNWWFRDLPEPQRLGITLLQMRKGKLQVPAALENKIVTERMRPGWNRGSGYFTGANKVDYCTHWLYGACLIKDVQILTDAVDGVFSPMAFTTGEGLQYDYSYFQHGNQLYIGGYGDELIKGNTLIASYVAGTGFDMPAERMTMLSNFMRQTWLPSIRGKYLFWNITGRGMSRNPSQLNKGGSGATYTERMISIDPANAAEYAAAVKRLRGEEPANYNVTPQSTLFYRGDYALHVRPKYSVDLRLLSTRTKTIEFGNNENLKNFYLSDGSMDIATHGQEYDGIFAVWDWTRIPGVTTPQRPFTPEHIPAGFVPDSDGSSNPYTPHGTNMGGTGTSTFAGGASDSTYTVAAYNYSAATTGVGGKKGWFFFDDEVVCLGAGINSNASVASYDIFTTLNQAHLKGDVIRSGKMWGDMTAVVLPPVTLPAQTAETYTNSPEWVWHDGVGYIFPQGGNVGVSNKTQSGNWYDINMSAPNATVTGDVFTLYVNHGKAVTSGTYAYILVPGKTATETADYATNSKVEIVTNTDSVQIVHQKELGIYSVIFYKAASFDGEGIAIKVNNPCVLILKEQTDGNYVMNIANPAQSTLSVKVETRLPATASDWKTTNVSFTGNASPNYNAGQSKVYNVEKSTVTVTDITAIEVNDPVVSVQYYNLMGQSVRPTTGVYVIQKTHASGKKTVKKELKVIH
ncbi:MAG: Chondroitinase-AC [Candidatus Ordinivivax streblomastigis]|uniref:Chondroitinase-AC n=1 Tax=Candidatus Ordinivivax streblomastigis TaxID=2540710 RepID=A0A5M8P5N1_9BACT|nr:MAG: Chondroitinase-AC [Candidatus Ordinivivax streblomastigis]